MHPILYDVTSLQTPLLLGAEEKGFRPLLSPPSRVWSSATYFHPPGRGAQGRGGEAVSREIQEGLGGEGGCRRHTFPHLPQRSEFI